MKIEPITKMTNKQLEESIKDLWYKIIEFSEAREELIIERIKRKLRKI